MKKITEIKKERAYYFVSIDGLSEFESESLNDCKKYLCDYVKTHKAEIEENGDYNYFIGMYNIGIEE